MTSRPRSQRHKQHPVDISVGGITCQHQPVLIRPPGWLWYVSCWLNRIITPFLSCIIFPGCCGVAWGGIHRNCYRLMHLRQLLVNIGHCVGSLPRLVLIRAQHVSDNNWSMSTLWEQRSFVSYTHRCAVVWLPWLVTWSKESYIRYGQGHKGQNAPGREVWSTKWINSSSYHKFLITTKCFIISLLYGWIQVPILHSN